MRGQTQETEGPSHYTTLYDLRCVTCGHQFRSEDSEAGCPLCAQPLFALWRSGTNGPLEVSGNRRALEATAAAFNSTEKDYYYVTSFTPPPSFGR